MKDLKKNQNRVRVDYTNKKQSTYTNMIGSSCHWRVRRSIHAGSFPVTQVLFTIRMRSQLLGRVSAVAAFVTNRKKKCCLLESKWKIKYDLLRYKQTNRPLF